VITACNRDFVQATYADALIGERCCCVCYSPITDDSGFDRTAAAVQYDHVYVDCEQLDAPEELFGSVMSALAERMAWIQ
jgi:hypothetical protein